MRTQTKRRRLSPTEAAEADARMRHFLVVLNMERVYRAACRSGWYTMDIDRLDEGEVLHHCGRTYYLFAGDGWYRLEDLLLSNVDTVTLRKVAGPESHPGRG